MFVVGLHGGIRYGDRATAGVAVHTAFTRPWRSLREDFLS